MICSEPESSSAADYYYGSLSSFPAEQTKSMMGVQCWNGGTTPAASGFSVVEANAICNVTASTQPDALTDIFNHNALRFDSVIDLFEANNYSGSIESSGPPSYWPQESSGNGGLNNFVQLNHLLPKEETVASGTYMNIDWQQAESMHTVNLDSGCEFQSNLKGEADASYLAPILSRRLPQKRRERSEADARRRSIVGQKVKALQELLPGALKRKRGNQESTVHDITSYIKYLQFQLKELSRSRLGGESSSGSLKFVEGYGHYHPDAQKFDESLEETIGSLFEENPAAASELLENNGLYTVPMASVDALLCTRGGNEPSRVEHQQARLELDKNMLGSARAR